LSHGKVSLPFRRTAAIRRSPRRGSQFVASKGEVAIAADQHGGSADAQLRSVPRPKRTVSRIGSDLSNDFAAKRFSGETHRERNEYFASETKLFRSTPRNSVKSLSYEMAISQF
jgi:hypothetical protein